MAQHGNQCALITDRYAPCYMEVDGHPPELEECKFQGTGREIEFQEFEAINAQTDRMA